MGERQKYLEPLCFIHLSELHRSPITLMYLFTSLPVAGELYPQLPSLLNLLNTETAPLATGLPPSGAFYILLRNRLR